jgi:hypothetical protein
MSDYGKRFFPSLSLGLLILFGFVSSTNEQNPLVNSEQQPACYGALGWSGRWAGSERCACLRLGVQASCLQ